MKPYILTLILSALFAMATQAQTNDLSVAKRGNKYGYTNTRGETVIFFAYQDAMPFGEGLAAVKKRGRWGYIDTAGVEVIKCQYDSAKQFTQHKAPVKTDSLWGYINRNGDVIINFGFHGADSYANGLARVYHNGKFGYINEEGSVHIPLNYSLLSLFSEGLAAARDDSLRWGFVNSNGDLVVDFRYDSVLQFEDKMAAVKLGKKWGYIDPNGKLLVDFVYNAPVNRELSLDFPWAYADYIYAQLRRRSPESEQTDTRQHLQTAVAKIEDEGDFFSQSELKRLRKYHRRLGNNKIAQEYMHNLRQKRIEDRINVLKQPAVTMDLSLGVEPVSFLLHNNVRDLPVYAQYRFGVVGVGARYKAYTNYTDKFRFGAWQSALQWPDEKAWNVYSGQDYGLFLHFFDSEYVKKARYWYGYGYGGHYFGFEYGRNNYSFAPINTLLDDGEGNTAQQTINPTIQQQFGALNIGLMKGRGLLYFDLNLSMGYGWRTIDYGFDTEMYTTSDKRLSKERLYTFFVPVRAYVRVGVNIF